MTNPCENYRFKDIPPTTSMLADVVELEALAAPLVDWIRKYHDPHTQVVVEWDHVWLRHDGASIPFPYSET